MDGGSILLGGFYFLLRSRVLRFGQVFWVLVKRSTPIANEVKPMGR